MSLLDSIKDSVKSTASDIKSSAEEKVSDVKETVTGKIADIKGSFSELTSKGDSSKQNTGYDVYTEKNDDELNKSQNEKEDKIVEFMKNIAVGQLEKFKNLENLFGGLFNGIDWSSFLDPDKIGDTLKNWLKDKLKELGDKFLDALDDLKDKAIEFAKEKFENIMETVFDSIVIPDEVFLAGISAAYYTRGADLAYQNELVRRACIDHDYPKSLEWCHKQFKYSYVYKLDKGLCENDMRDAYTKGCHKVCNYIIGQVYKEYVSYKKRAKTLQKEYNLTKSESLRVELEELRNDIKSIEKFIIDSFKNMIVYSYPTLILDVLVGYINSYKDPDTGKPIFLPKYLGETDDVYGGKYFLTKSDLDVMAKPTRGFVQKIGEDLQDVRKVTLVNQKNIKSNIAPKDDSIANAITTYTPPPQDFVFEKHDPVNHIAVQNSYKDTYYEIIIRNAFIKLIYVYLSNYDIWGNDCMVHCHFYSRLKCLPKNPITDLANKMSSSKIFSMVKDVAFNESSAADFVNTMYDFLFNPSTFLNFGDVSGLTNLFYQNFPVSEGANNSVFVEINQSIDRVSDGFENYMKNNLSSLTENYIREYLYFEPETDFDEMVSKSKDTFMKSFDIVRTIIEESDTQSYYYYVKTVVNHIIRFIHENYFKLCHAGSTMDPDLPEESFEISKIIFSGNSYDLWETNFDYINYTTLYGLFFFYYNANTFKVTNEQPVKYKITPLRYKMTLRRLIRLIDGIIINCSFISKEYAREQDNTITVLIKDHSDVYKYIINESAVQSPFTENVVPINTGGIFSDELEFINTSLSLTDVPSQQVDSVLRTHDIHSKYKCLRETSKFILLFPFYYLTEDSYKTHKTDRTILDNSFGDFGLRNVTGFDEIMINGFLKIYEIMWNLFTNNLYDLNNLDIVENEVIDVDDPYIKNTVINTVKEVSGEDEYISHLKYKKMGYRLRLSKK